MSAFLPQVAIRDKRDGGSLSDDALRAMAAGAADGSIPDYQLAAFLMAVFFRGMDDRELAVWADAMLRSGDIIDLSGIGRPKVDKHSTGGVGDKISIPLAPAAAACGLAVPMVSGRGLGHTGGTLDKLESIPGFRVDIDTDTFVRQVDELGLCLAGQTARIAPADRTLYALRDVTATVESVPLIASSIMSKKLAEDLDGLVLDCKVGSGAFMRTRQRAEQLAHAIRVIGEAAGVKVCVVLSAMDEPIGSAVGNAMEILESIEVLRGGGPPDTRELTVRLGAEMLRAGGVVLDDDDDARRRIEAALDSGDALECFRRVVEAQGGDPRVADDPARILPAAPERKDVVAPASGVITDIASRDIGMAALRLGAGRVRKEDSVDPSVGIEVIARVGQRVSAGDPVAVLHHAGRGVETAERQCAEAFTISGDAEPTPPPSRILDVLR